MSPSRRRVLHLVAVALSGTFAGCGGRLREESETATPATADDPTTADPATADPATETPPTPEDSLELPEGPKSLPERPDELTRESVREYVRTLEYRWVYNRLYHGSETEIEVECGVDSISDTVCCSSVPPVYRTAGNSATETPTSRGDAETSDNRPYEDATGFRVVVWCSASAETETYHADYFTQYATYVVGPDALVRHDGKSKARG